MVKWSRALIAFAVIFLTVISCEAAKKTVAVMPLENVSGYTEQRVAEIMTEQLIAAINGSGNYVVVERVQMGTVLKEQGFQSIAAGKSVDTGEMSGADYSVVGKVIMADVSDTAANSLAKKLFGKDGHTILMHSHRGRVSLNFRFVDNKTGEIIFDATVEGDKTGKSVDGVIHDACKDAANNALKEINNHNPFTARIIKISGDLFYIDAGLDSGLRNGENLLIMREDAPIESNGKIVVTHTKIGDAKITEVNGDYSVCRVKKSTGVIRAGDVVKRGQ